MKNLNVKKLLALLAAFALLMSALPALAQGDAPIPVTEIQKYGNLMLGISGSDVLAMGYEYGDVITATINGGEYEMPVCTNYSDVDNGSLVLRITINPSDGTDTAIMAINMGDLATTAGIATKAKIEEEPGYRWDLCEGVSEPVTVTIAMKEKGGYYDQWMIHQLVRTNERADYASLTDAEFANFRVVATTGMGENVLYRASSPVNPELNRNKYADDALKAAGVKTCVNLADTDEGMRAYEGWADSYYSTCSIISLNLGVDFSADDFKSGLAEGMRFIINNDGPYLVHCNEGKDRAGFASGLLECLMGATAEEAVKDYMTTYRNYYGVQEGTEQYDIVASSNIKKSLAAAFGVDDIYAEGVNLAEKAEGYLLGIGLSADEIASLKLRLSGNK